MQPDTEKTGLESTMRAVLLGAVLAAVLAGSNAYLGLKVGMTVSASIPAAVLSMALLRMARRSGILENNLVQTAASAGESLAAGVIFTLPALILLGHWDGFPYLPVAGIALLGGLIGVGFSIPLRRVLLADRSLRFPEGVATAEVLMAGHGKVGGIRALVWGGVVGGAVKIAQGGLRVVTGSAGGGVTAGKGIFALGIDCSPALLAVGYIVGLPVACLMAGGGMIAWLVAIPLETWINGSPPGLTGYAAALHVWSTRIRYLGVGAMVVGGAWSLMAMAIPLARGLAVSFSTRSARAGEVIPREEQDTPGSVLAIGLLLTIIPLLLLYRHVVPPDALPTSAVRYAVMLGMAVVLAMVGGFLFSAVAGYMAGLVGSSHNPVSGVTIATILGTSLLLLALVGSDRPAAAAAAAILVGAVVCCAAAISGDNLQDLKAGQIVGATPWRQQLMQVIGVVAGAAAIGPILNLLYQAYGIGGRLPRPDMDPTAVLAAPQATLMQTVALGVFERRLPWDMILAGAALAVLVIAIDQLLRRRGSRFRMPVLAVAIGLYLPVELTLPILLGGIAAYVAAKATRSTVSKAPTGLLLASGLIAGEALAGIALAVPFALARDTNVLRIAGDGFTPYANVLAAIIVCGVLVALARSTPTSK